MRFLGQKITPPTIGHVPLPPIPPPQSERYVSGEFTNKLDLFIPEQESAYDVDHFNYNFEILDRFSNRMMFAGYVDARTQITTYLSINAKLLLQRIAEKRGYTLAVAEIERGELPLVSASYANNIGSPQTNEGNYYIVSAINGENGEGVMFGLHFKPNDWLVSTGESWAKINNNGYGGLDLEIVGSEWIEVVTEGNVRRIVYKETWRPTDLPVR